MSTVAETLDLPTIVTPITPAYRGRFAPTPSGPLHLGSLLTALASWLAARQVGGEWRLRIDDLDQPRCLPGAEDLILRQLEAHGLLWDGTPERQTTHQAQYRAALQQLDAQELLYPCNCTRATLAASSLSGPDGPVYAGTCRNASTPPAHPAALRLRLPPGELQWQDGIQGLVQRAVPQECGDFVLRRADGLIAYHLACVLDELRMGITEVLRGADLVGATAQQLALMKSLGERPPAYAHVPVLLADDGRKLSKQNGAAAIDTGTAAVARQLLFCLEALQLSPPAALAGASAKVILEWALPHWDKRHPGRLTKRPALLQPLP